MADASAAAVFQYLGLPVPKRERVAKVYIQARDIQPGVLEGYADKLAATVVTAAMCHGVTKIELHFPNRQAVYLDCDDIKKAFAAELGFWPTQRMAPTEASVYDLWRMGTRFEPWRPMVSVPERVSDHVVADGVSGDEPALKED